jgi:hypothetical protein
LVDLLPDSVCVSSIKFVPSYHFTVGVGLPPDDEQLSVIEFPSKMKVGPFICGGPGGTENKKSERVIVD